MYVAERWLTSAGRSLKSFPSSGFPRAVRRAPGEEARCRRLASCDDALGRFLRGGWKVHEVGPETPELLLVLPGLTFGSWLGNCRAPAEMRRLLRRREVLFCRGAWNRSLFTLKPLGLATGKV